MYTLILLYMHVMAYIVHVLVPVERICVYIMYMYMYMYVHVHVGVV